MKNICILITSEYPYGSAETFLEGEIGILSERFDCVYIFAISAETDSNKSRFTPKNVYSYALKEKNNDARIQYILKGAKLKNCFFKFETRNIAKCLADSFFIGKAYTQEPKVLRILENENLDSQTRVLIYSYWFAVHSTIGVLLKNDLKKMGCKVLAVTRAHGYDLYKNRNKLNYLPLRNQLVSNLDYIFPCSKNGCDYLQNEYHSSKIRVSRLGTKDYGIKQSTVTPKVLVTCSRLIQLKRISFFAEVFATVCQKDPDIKWICIGDGPEMSKIKSIISDKDVSQKVVFTGSLSNAAVMALYAKENIGLFCNVSQYEGVPVSIMEAMSFGIPAIATNVGGTSEIVNNSNGRLIDYNMDKESLANIICSELSSNEYHEKRKNARKTWESISNSQKNYTEFVSFLFDELCRE